METINLARVWQNVATRNIRDGYGQELGEDVATRKCWGERNENNNKTYRKVDATRQRRGTFRQRDRDRDRDGDKDTCTLGGVGRR